MFAVLLALLLVAAATYALISKEKSLQRTGEIFLVYVLVGYCGIPMIIVGVGAFLGFDLRGGTPTPIQSMDTSLQFTAMMLTAMGASATGAAFFRGLYLIGPAITWILYFAGATLIHMSSESEALNMGHGNMLILFATHGLISIILAVTLAASGLINRTQSHA